MSVQEALDPLCPSSLEEHHLREKGGGAILLTMEEHNWWQVLFTEHYLETDYADITAERPAQEGDFLVAVLPITITYTILDLACGYGRHAVELARRGYTVTGFDYSRPFITKAKREAEAA